MRSWIIWIYADFVKTLDAEVADDLTLYDLS